MATKNNILDFSLGDYYKLVESVGLPKYRAKQMIEWIWQKGAQSYAEMQNLPKHVREQLELEPPLQRGIIALKQVSKDKSRKYLIQFADGVCVETVGIPSASGKLTVCISTQAGCKLKCTFCATGRSGFTRNLTAGEIAEQVYLVQRDFAPELSRVNTVVVMGQGEPFLNYEPTLAGLRIINSKDALNIGARNITVSTAGIIQEIERFSHEPEQFNLALSLHSAIQSTRDKLMPGLKGYPVNQLRRALKHYYSSTKRRPSLEYILIEGVNDTRKEIDELTQYAQSIGAYVNLIPLNETGDGNHSTAKKVADDITDKLKAAGVQASVRSSRGSDIAAACGQLAQRA